MNLKDIKEILSSKKLDARVIPLVELFVLGKSRVDNLEDKEIRLLIDKLCVNIRNTEFIEDEKIIAAYTEGAGILSINKNYLTENKLEEAIVPIFMKMEQALHPKEENEYARHSLDLLEAFNIARELKIPISGRLRNLGFFSEMLIANTKEFLNNEHIKDIDYLDRLAENFENTLNEMIITGIDDKDGFLEGYRMINLIRYQEKDDGKRDSLYSKEEAIKLIRIIDSLGRKKPIVEAFQNSVDRTYDDYIRPDLMRQGGVSQEEIASYEFPVIETDDGIKSQIARIGAIKPEEITVEFIKTRVNEIVERKKNSWNQGMSNLLIPFFIRSTIIFGWNLDELNQRLNELDANIKTMEYAETGFKDDVMGSAGKDDIRIRKEAYGHTFDDYRIPISTLFHEVGHAIDSNTREGIVSKANEGYVFDKFYEWRNSVFEYLVSRSSGGFYKDDYAFIVDPVTGYIETMNAGSMLSAALGISELDFARLKDRGNDSIGNFIMEVTGMSREEVIPQPFRANKVESTLLERIVVDFDLSYPMPFDFKNRSRNQERLNDMYEICMQIMRKRMEKDFIQGDGDADDYIVRQAYFLRKINANYKAGTKELGARTKRYPLTHSIDFINDKISEIVLFDIGSEFMEMVNFGFDNSRDIAPYRLKDLKPKKQSIFDKLKLPFVPTIQKGETKKQDNSKDKENIK